MGTHLRFSSTMAPYERTAERDADAGRPEDVSGRREGYGGGGWPRVRSHNVETRPSWRRNHHKRLCRPRSSDAFRVFHPEEVREKMKVFDKGAVSDYVRSPISEDFKELHEAFLEEGLYDSYMPYFVAKFVGCLVALAGALYLERRGPWGRLLVGSGCCGGYAACAALSPAGVYGPRSVPQWGDACARVRLPVFAHGGRGAGRDLVGVVEAVAQRAPLCDQLCEPRSGYPAPPCVWAVREALGRVFLHLSQPVYAV